MTQIFSTPAALRRSRSIAIINDGDETMKKTSKRTHARSATAVAAATAKLIKVNICNYWLINCGVINNDFSLELVGLLSDTDLDGRRINNHRFFPRCCGEMRELRGRFGVGEIKN